MHLTASRASVLFWYAAHQKPIGNPYSLTAGRKQDHMGIVLYYKKSAIWLCFPESMAVNVVED
jgi:hypothetical protein